MNKKLLFPSVIASCGASVSDQAVSLLNCPRRNTTEICLKQTATMALLVLGSVLSNSSLAESYTFTELGTTLGGIDSFAYAVNNAGLLTGNTANPVAKAYLWNGSNTTNLGALGGTGSFGLAINDAGLVAGYAFTAGDTVYHATRWNGSSVTDLGTLGGTNSQANAINNAGLVAGSASTAGNNNYIHATLWNGTTATDLGTLGGNYSQATAINDAGQVAGFSLTAVNATFRHATLWNGSTVTDLGTLGGDYSEATAINNDGQVAGDAYIAGNTIRHAALWNGTTLTDLGTLGGINSNNSVATAINKNGVVVGYSDIVNAGAFALPAYTTHAALWSGTTVTDLNTFLDANTLGAGWVLTEATGINDKGWIVGNASNSLLGIYSHAFLLKPPSSIPVPSAVWLFGSGLIGLTSFIRKLKTA